MHRMSALPFWLSGTTPALLSCEDTSCSTTLKMAPWRWCVPILKFQTLTSSYVWDSYIHMYAFLIQFDMKNQRTFLRRTKFDELHQEDLFVGNRVNIFSRQLNLTGYGDQYTANKLGSKKERYFIPEHHCWDRTCLSKPVWLSSAEHRKDTLKEVTLISVLWPKKSETFLLIFSFMFHKRKKAIQVWIIMRWSNLMTESLYPFKRKVHTHTHTQ